MPPEAGGGGGRLCMHAMVLLPGNVSGHRPFVIESGSWLCQQHSSQHTRSQSQPSLTCCELSVQPEGRCTTSATLSRPIQCKRRQKTEMPCMLMQQQGTQFILICLCTLGWVRNKMGMSDSLHMEQVERTRNSLVPLFECLTLQGSPGS